MNTELLNVGDQAPDFSLPNYSGETVSLNDFKGKNIILWFFPKANTPGWAIEGQGFREEFRDFQKLGYEIIGVSGDSLKKQKKFVEKYSFPFMMLCDESHDMLKIYKVWALKKFMGREYMGISRVTYIIDEDGKIEHVIEKVKTMSHAKDLLTLMNL